MNELIDFAARLIELEGGAAVAHAAGLEALVPPPLRAAWDVREELVLSEHPGAGEHLAYGTELLERMLQTATEAIPFARVRLEAQPVRGNQLRSAGEHWQLRNGVVEVEGVRLGPQLRIWVDALATLHGDERRELLTAAALSAHSGTVVEGFTAGAFGLLADAADHPQPPAGSFDHALRACREQAEGAASGFREAMTRRFERDRLRIEGYFDDLLRELDKRAAKGRLDVTTVADKRSAMLADRAAKLDALSARFVLRIEVQPIALRSVALDGGFVSLKLRRRKASRVIELEYDAITRKLVPPSCEVCDGPAVRPAACDDAVHLLCERCAPRCEGRVHCARCAANKGCRRDTGCESLSQ
jgi:hypothetical protein